MPDVTINTPSIGLESYFTYFDIILSNKHEKINTRTSYRKIYKETW